MALGHVLFRNTGELRPSLDLALLNKERCGHSRNTSLLFQTSPRNDLSACCFQKVMSFPEFQHIYHLHFIISPGLALVVGIAAGLFVLYTLTLAIYSIYFSPLRKIPGPKLWIAFPILRHLAEFSGNMDRQIRAFHETYGEVVRLADDEVSFTTAKAWSDIHGHGHRQLPKVLQFEKDDSQILQSNDFDHARYRKALSPAFSEKALRDQEPLMKVHIDLLIEKLKDVAASESRADMVQWYNLTTFDLIGDLAFGEPFRGLIDQKIHHWIANIFLLVKLGPVVRAARTYPLLTELFGLFLPRDLRQSRETQNEFSRSIVTNRIHNEAQHGRGDFMDSMLKHKDDKDALTFKELVANATVLIIAGSETTATLLSGVTYWLLKTPLALKKVTEEVRSQFQSEQEIDFIHASSRLPYMLACLDEGLRRYPPVPTGIRRITLPDGPSIIAGVELPPNVSLPT